MGPALKHLPLITAGSGVAIGLAHNAGLAPVAEASRLARAQGHRAIVSGSCSNATNAQVADFIARGGQVFAVDPLQLADGLDVVAQAVAWAQPRLAAGPVLIQATAQSNAVRDVQAQLGVARAGEIVERALASIAYRLVQHGVGQLIIAGGETSGACVQALGVRSMRVGPQIAPGVPWCHASSPHAPAGSLHLALKSGNFGSVDFFMRAFELLA